MLNNSEGVVLFLFSISIHFWLELLTSSDKLESKSWIFRSKLPKSNYSISDFGHILYRKKRLQCLQAGLPQSNVKVVLKCMNRELLPQTCISLEAYWKLAQSSFICSVCETLSRFRSLLMSFNMQFIFSK